MNTWLLGQKGIPNSLTMLALTTNIPKKYIYIIKNTKSESSIKQNHKEEMFSKQKQFKVQNITLHQTQDGRSYNDKLFFICTMQTFKGLQTFFFLSNTIKKQTSLKLHCTYLHFYPCSGPVQQNSALTSFTQRSHCISVKKTARNLGFDCKSNVCFIQKCS